MSFFERAKAAANDLAAKADAEMKKAGISTPGWHRRHGAGAGAVGADRALRDLGVLAYLEATGRPASADDRARVLATLRELESTGRLGPLTRAPAPTAPRAPPPPPAAGGCRASPAAAGRHPATAASARAGAATATAAAAADRRRHRRRPRAGPSRTGEQRPQDVRLGA